MFKNIFLFLKNMIGDFYYLSIQVVKFNFLENYKNDVV